MYDDGEIVNYPHTHIVFQIKKAIMLGIHKEISFKEFKQQVLQRCDRGPDACC